MDPWGDYQLPDLLALAKARNDAQWEHEKALIRLLVNAFAAKPRPGESLKPFKELDSRCL